MLQRISQGKILQFHCQELEKNELITMKHSSAPLTEIKYVSNLLHNKIKKHISPSKSSSLTNHDRYISKNYVKCTLQYETLALPTFSVAGCTEYFVKIFSLLTLLTNISPFLHGSLLSMNHLIHLIKSHLVTKPLLLSRGV